MADENSTACLPQEFGKASDGFITYAKVYSVFAVCMLTSGAFLWFRHREELYLRRRNPELVALASLGVIANLICGPLYRTALDSPDAFRVSCFWVNFNFFVTIPFALVPQYARLELFKNRFRFNRKVAEIFESNIIRDGDDDRSYAASSMVSGIIGGYKLKKLKYRASAKFGLMIAVSGIFMSSIFGFVYASISCPTFGGNECSYAGFSSTLQTVLIALPILTLIALHVYIQRRTQGEPDVFRIIRETRVSYYFPLFLGLPGTALATLDPGGIQEEIPFRWKWTLLIDFAFAGYFVWSVHYQVYRALKIKYNASEASGVTLSSILKSETGFVLFEQHVINEFSAENLTCWKAIRDYKTKFDSVTPAANVKTVKRIYHRFIKPGSFFEVNISGASKEAFDELLDLDPSSVTKDVFDSVEQELYNLMSNDSFIRFANSAAFQSYTGQAEVSIEHVESFFDEEESG